MPITRIELTRYRNYGAWSLHPDPALTILVGPNAAGKTNVIEAIQLLTTGRSFRSARWSDLVQWGKQSGSAAMEIAREGSTARVEMDVTADGRRTYSMNGKTVRRVTDVTRVLPCVTFTPDDLALSKGPSENRRAAIDDLGEQLSKTFGSIRRDYMKALRQRNRALRDGEGQATIDALAEQIAHLGARLAVHRRRLLARVEDHATAIYARLSRGEDLAFTYADRCGFGGASHREEISAAEATACLLGEIMRRSGDERSRKVTLAGPHRDDVVFLVDGKDARAFASQGQQRTIALAWKWAEVRVVEEVAHRKPVLLLDDVMSELDARRRAALTGLVQEDVQTFITTTNTGYFDQALLGDAKVVSIEHQGE
ncbi:MAG: DNA replication/repair protein RecF [Anaerosomatales bacterium]|nr:DNA replication/repair protein RecF [Anaerosomatales bacterium]